ncbi:SGNH/GDSL hydrolase family protein [Candidatus Electronema sp. PJ]|uniref:SGNH/GDSL hydrolase family protein n=1 Tax=Candidatus Electronema sp. PJ TaxID=3401572 RepID=UPI003AA86D23
MNEFIQKNKAVLYVVYLLFLIGLLLAGGEFIARKKKVQPWRPGDIRVQVEPGGHFFTKHPKLGYAPLPGRFTVTLSRTGYSFHVTHLANGLRITHPLASYNPARHKPEIWIFGCSFTHGWSLNDEQTYPWQLQERLPKYEIVNFGFNGYGTIHSLIQFRDALTAKTPEIAVLAYANIHDERNTFLRNRRKAVAPWNRLGPLVQPYARLNSDRTLQYFLADVEYTEFPFMRRSALVHFLEIKWNQFEERVQQSRKVSEALVLEMAQLAREHNVKFILATIGKDPQMLAFAQQNGIPNVDISVNFRENIRYMNLPHDGHPSALANKAYADHLENFLRKGFIKQKVSTAQ